MARILVFMSGKRVLVFALAAFAAAITAKGVIGFHPNGFFDGPH